MNIVVKLLFTEHLDYIRTVTNSTDFVGLGADYDGVDS